MYNQGRIKNFLTALKPDTVIFQGLPLRLIKVISKKKKKKKNAVSKLECILNPSALEVYG